jgi:hypothetical protein
VLLLRVLPVLPRQRQRFPKYLPVPPGNDGNGCRRSAPGHEPSHRCRRHNHVRCESQLQRHDDAHVQRGRSVRELVGGRRGKSRKWCWIAVAAVGRNVRSVTRCDENHLGRGAKESSDSSIQAFWVWQASQRLLRPVLYKHCHVPVFRVPKRWVRWVYDGKTTDCQQRYGFSNLKMSQFSKRHGCLFLKSIAKGICTAGTLPFSLGKVDETTEREEAKGGDKKYEGQNWPPTQGPWSSGIAVQKIHSYLH